MSFTEQHPEFLKAAGGPDWLGELRNAGIARFAELGFPTTRDEDWRFTDVSPIRQTAFTPAVPAGADVAGLLQGSGGSDWPGHHLVFVDGVFTPDQSAIGALPAGVRLGGLADILAATPELLQPHLGTGAAVNGNPFTALNTGFIRDGAAIFLGDDIDERVTVNLWYVSTGATANAVTQPRTLIVVGRNGNFTVTENYVGPGDACYLTNAVTEIILAENAVIDHTKMQLESETAYHIAAMHVHAARDSRFKSHAITTGGAITRNTIKAQLDDENIECTLNGLYLGHGRQLVDNHTCIEHAHPNCNSSEIYKGILDDKARGVFNGRIHVRQDAQKTDALQTNRALLLSDDARVNTKPELEIHADDVRCTHGATVGQLDEAGLFYLRSRGIDAETARGILTYAFACEAVTDIESQPVRDTIEQLLIGRYRQL
ncbi:MAG: Fe-S cluster assembly protein SufD [Lentisphaeria bacterium]|jgi:Fe-S cluster assembly protein SufD|nr:Fe-S cluster assembly protein SufD [Lentisphaeria bacterium]MDP7742347.1 Fe-S cluster assembly protein SufD [Lentisphaeria bacterium]